ncbi:MAG: hypothetical protein A3H79_04840 [Candidatus Levybacteria bacterium RIFCSPLOWO2_02_FULL_36_8b]|nr:MAG: hypothetical protein A3H79_04840 [Candidatus Levybacteria bacterium RIFCSPLOWO2_02_FULL_36_8b]
MIDLPLYYAPMGVEQRSYSSFSPHKEVIGESRYRVVFGHSSPHFAVKEFKPGKIGHFSSTQEAMDEIRRHREEQSELISAIISEGSQPLNIPSSDYVIHAAEDGKVTYSEVQPWIHRGSTLYDLGLGVMSLPSASLDQLENTFQASLSIWGQERNLIDLVGSSAKKFNIFQKALRRLLPIFYAENLVVDQNGNVQIIDFGKYAIGFERSPARDRVNVYAELVGTYISRGILKLTKFARGLN